MTFAAEYGNKRYISWAFSKNMHCTMETLFHLSRFGHVDLMKWLHGMGNIPHAKCLMIAANYNHKSVIDWLVSISIVDSDFLSILAENGYTLF